MQDDPVWLLPMTNQVLGAFDARNGRVTAPARAAERRKLAWQKEEIGTSGLPKQYAAIADKLAPKRIGDHRCASHL
jgi:hypothetical protein